MSRVVVTGGLGIIGSWVVRELLAQGHEPVSVDEREDLRLVADIVEHFERQTVNVLDLPTAASLTQTAGVDAIAHLAVSEGGAAEPYSALTVNGQGTVSMLEAARLGDVPRFVFGSSKAVFGSFLGEYGHPTYRPVPADHPRLLYRALSFAAAKLYGEEAAALYAERYGIETVSLRFATVIAPGKQARHGPTGVHSRIIENALVGEGSYVEQGAEEHDDMIYVRDVAQSIVRACLAPGPLARAYNIGSGQIWSLGEFAAAVRRHVADVEITIGPGLNYLVGLPDIACRMDIEPARRELGYEPAFDLDAMVLDYVDAFRRLGVVAQANQGPSDWDHA